jgi:hypothetical protein
MSGRITGLPPASPYRESGNRAGFQLPKGDAVQVW